MRTSHVAAPVVAALLAAALLAPSAATDLGKDMAAKLAKLNLTEAAAAAKVPGHIGLTTAKSWLDQKPGKTLKSLDMKCGEQIGICPAGFCCRRASDWRGGRQTCEGAGARTLPWSFSNPFQRTPPPNSHAHPFPANLACAR